MAYSLGSAAHGLLSVPRSLSSWSSNCSYPSSSSLDTANPIIQTRPRLSAPLGPLTFPLKHLLLLRTPTVCRHTHGDTRLFPGVVGAEVGPIMAVGECIGLLWGKTCELERDRVLGSVSMRDETRNTRQARDGQRTDQAARP
jgi:hypothetical protein